MVNNFNKSLWWYGWKARFKQDIGKFLIVAGIFFGLFGMMVNTIFWIIIFLLCLGFGIYFIATGSSQRFDFQRQSGTIIHGGDNFR